MWSQKIEQPSEDHARSQRQTAASPPAARSAQSTHRPSTANRRHNLPPVLGTALMEADIPASDAEASNTGSDVRSGVASPRSNDSRSGIAGQRSNATALTVVVTHPKRNSARTNGYGPVSEKRPSYQHSTEHLRAGAPSVAPSPDRPRSSPPDLGDLGDCSDQSFSKVCCSTTAIATAGTMERRSSRFFKKVKLWKGWRKEPSDG
jgi:3',5'-cyclic-nucleotide phosphodiesterase